MCLTSPPGASDTYESLRTSVQSPELVPRSQGYFSYWGGSCSEAGNLEGVGLMLEETPCHRCTIYIVGGRGHDLKEDKE